MYLHKTDVILAKSAGWDRRIGDAGMFEGCAHDRKRRSGRAVAYGQLGVGVAAISFAAIFIKFTSAPPAVTAMWRMWLTAAVLAPFAWRANGVPWRGMNPRSWLLLFVSGGVLAIHFVFWIRSLFYTSVASSTLLLSLQPVFALIGVRIFFGQRPPRLVWLEVGVAVLGTALIGWGDLRLGGAAPYGDLLSILGAAAAAAYFLAGQGLRRNMPSLSYSMLVYSVAAAFLTLYSLARGYSLTGYDWTNWRSFILLALVPTLFGHTLFNSALRHLPASTVSVSIVGEPLGATVLAYFIFGSRVAPSWFAGAALVAAGVWSYMRTMHAADTRLLAEAAESEW
jgi:drug/metabolite transporter (DMT)-like permease